MKDEKFSRVKLRMKDIWNHPTRGTRVVGQRAMMDEVVKKLPGGLRRI